MKNVEDVLCAIKKASTPEGIKRKAYFGITETGNFGLTAPQIKAIAKKNRKKSFSGSQTLGHICS